MGVPQDLRTHAPAFTADDHSHLLQLCAAQIHGPVAKRSDRHRNILLPKAFLRCLPSRQLHRSAKYRTHRCTNHLMAIWVCTALQQRHRDAKGIGSTQDRTQIPRVLNAVQQQHTRLRNEACLLRQATQEKRSLRSLHGRYGFHDLSRYPYDTDIFRNCSFHTV